MTIKIGFVLVLLMALLQAFYGIFAYLDPMGFSVLRGTELASHEDVEWVQIYASRTVFIALVVGYLLYLRNFAVLFWVALFGLVMPVTDAWGAYNSGASVKVVSKHLATIFYLIATSVVLRLACLKSNK